MFGKHESANTVLRWLSLPLFRIGFLLIVVPIALSGHSSWIGAVGLCFLVVSLAATGTNAMLLRRRRSRAGGSV
jgi:hypothetical protein